MLLRSDFTAHRLAVALAALLGTTGVAEAATRGSAGDGFTASFEQGEPQPAATADGALRVQVGNGPAAPYAAKKAMGVDGLHALRYDGGDGRAMLFDVDMPVRADTTLSWFVLPEIVDGDTAVSTAVSVDLVFDDGRRLSQLGARDHHGAGVDAAAQAASKTLYPQQWARKAVRLGDVEGLRGRRVRAIELVVAPGAGKLAQGWIDSIAIADVPHIARAHPSDHVRTTRGTQSNGVFSRGNNIAATAMPHGFNFWVPVTDAGVLNLLYRWSEHNGDDNRPRLQALSVSHQPSPWMGDRQTFQVMPSAATGVPDADRGRRALSFSHDNEVARPHHYRVDFDNGIRAEMAPTERAALMRFRFPEGTDANLLFDNVDDRGGLSLDEKTGTVSGYSDVRSRLSNGATRLFVFARFDQPWAGSGMLETGRPTGYVKFRTGRDREVRMRIATSLVSVEQARKNLDLELGDSGFDTVRDRAQGAWDALLGRVRVDGASEDQLATVYGNLYRLYLYPNVAHENVGTAKAPDWRHAVQSSWADDATGGDALRSSAEVRPGKVYVNNGFWDTFRTTWPAYALFERERAGELVDGFLQQARDGGWVARWSSPGYADLMVGTSSDVAFADAWLKGVQGFDPHEAYAAALRNATVVPPVDNVGRKGLGRSMYRGFADADVHEGMSWTLEGALNDFGLVQMAAKLADDATTPARAARYRDEAEYFRARAAGYAVLFDPKVGFFRGRGGDGAWKQRGDGAFDPRIWGGDYTEANAWTFAFTAAHDGAGLAALYGGRDGLAKKLDAFFTTPETADAKYKGTYRGVIHEMTEARDVRMGMYGHSNQPSHHIPWLYNDAGQPWQTQAKTREILRRLYLGSEIGQGYAGDEDNGEMSAWYLFSMLGLYPLRMGAPEYAIGSPLFPEAEIDIGGKRPLKVIARGNSAENVYVQSLTVDGEAWTSTSLPHARIADGATLEFTMGPEPSRWGTGAADLPETLTAAGERPSGLADAIARTKAGAATGKGAGTGAHAALFDDDAETVATLPAGDGAVVEAKVPAGADATFYTLTSGDAAIPSLGWVLEGWDGKAWVEADRRAGEAFAWARQLRPFRIAAPGKWTKLRLRLDAAGPVQLAEVELLRPVAH